MMVAPPARPCVPISTTSHQARWCALVVSAKLQRKRHLPAAQIDAAEEEIGGVRRAVLTALKSDPPRNQTQSGSRFASKLRNNKTEIARGEEEEGTTTPLSGSDVLLALQRATVQRSNSKSRSKSSRKRRGVNRSGGGGGEGEDTTDYNDVRPLNIKTDWGVRLDEMESLLQELRRLDC